MSASSIRLARPVKSALLIPFLSAFGIVLFLFFIDEGYYSFRWMVEPGNWFVFGMYMAIFFPFQWAISHFLLGKMQVTNKRWVMFGFVMPATIALFLWLVA